MRALRRFTVQPVLPATLAPLRELALNLRWAWNEDAKEVFRSIDPTLWEQVGKNPLRLLSTVPAERLEQLAADKVYVRHVELAKADLDDYLSKDQWFQYYAASNRQAPAAIGYFSAEFGITHALPQYSGGLGILAGDHLKAASDSGVPIIGVGLFYRNGYFRQSLDQSGWQQETYPVLDPHDMPLEQLCQSTAAGVTEPVLIEVPLNGQSLKAHIWVARVGRVPLLMLDTGIDDNPESLRGVTDKLYGGGAEHRIAQEVLLGIGGVRALRRYCEITGHPMPEVFHCNEGHAGFLGLERIREYLVQGLDFDTAVEFTRANNVFTTHTPVPAGIDRFPKELVVKQFASFAPLPLERILALGAEDFAGGDPEVFNMAIMGFRLGQRANGVSELHGQVSREMFQPLWPDFDSSEVPIGSVTNGVHHRTWIHPELQELLYTTTSEGKNIHDGYDFDAIKDVDGNTLWALKRQMRGSMIKMARERLAASCATRGVDGEWTASALSPHTLTFGFARRGASYKRLTLMLTDEERLKRLLNDPERPIQIVIAGKSHPADDTGKALIQRMVQFCDQEDVRGKIVFLPDYDMSLAQPLYPGCDVWINNPLRPLEACGTSGMKASLNGAANLSIKDGWWDEWFAPEFGWAIPSAEGITDPVLRDAAEAKSLYDIIENQIIPAFYDRDAQGLPQRWLTMMRSTIAELGPRLLASRMVQDYTTQLYLPAAKAANWAAADDHAHTLAQWKRRVRELWSDVTIKSVDSLSGTVVSLGDQTKFGTVVHLGRLLPEDVEVQLVAGSVDNSDELYDIDTFSMSKVADGDGGDIRYEVIAPASKAGSKGYLVRVVPRHDGLTNVAEMGLATVSE